MKSMYNRILIKLSGEALKGDGNDPILASALLQTAKQIKTVCDMGVEVAILPGGGNIWRARSAGNMERNRADSMGMLATTINALALCDALEKQGVRAVCYSAVAMNRFCEEFSARAAQAALSEKKVVVFACGSGLPFFTTDTAAALRACEINADALLLAKNVDALYDKNPDVYPDAVRLAHPTYDEVIARGLGGMDITAVTLCKEQKMPIVIFPLKGESSVGDAVCGIGVGTVIDS